MFVEEKAKGEVRELDEASKLLLKAADLIEERGWCRFSYGFVHQGPHCIRGAIINAGAMQGFGYTEGPKEALRKLDLSFGQTCGGSMAWNDRFAASQSEVIAKLRAVALSG